MRIESLCRRPPVGTLVEIEGKEYQFKADPETGREFCDVANPAHAEILLAITEGYRRADGAHAGAVGVAKATAKLEPQPEHRAPAQEPDIEHDREPETGDVDDGLHDMSRNDLAGVYASEVGRAPSTAMSKNDLIKAIRKARGN